jgi:SPP1 gp7 family putative phage head morphogenesis protein
VPAAKAKSKAQGVPLRVAPGAPEETLRAMRRRGVLLPDVYYSGKVSGLARSLSFSVAGVSSLEQLQAVKDSLDRTLKLGEGFEDWRKRVLRGEVPLSLPRHRLETIFRTNIQGAYSRGHGEQVKRHAKTHPYLMYSAVNDSRTRPAHRAWDKTILPIGHPWWATHRPINGYNCRCTVIALTEREAKRRGITEGPDSAPPDPGFDYDPWEDPKRGALAAIERKRRTGDPRLARKADDLALAAHRAGADDPDTWRQVGEQRGSNPGGLYEAPDGRRFYLKFYANPDQARAEVASLALYRAAGVDALEARLVERAGPGGARQLATATPWREDLERITRDDAPKHADELARIYSVSALVANWDVAGATLDNIARTAAGRLIVLDGGGSFTFRAQGAPKDYRGDQVPELQSLRSPLVNPSAAALFNPALDRDVFLERDAARSVLDALARSQAFDRALAAANVGPELAGAWRGALVRRAALMRDRYDLEGDYLPEQARGYLEELQGLFAGELSAWSARREVSGGHRSADLAEFETPAMVARFEAWARKRFPNLDRGSESGRDAARNLRRIFSDWSSTSTGDYAGALKLWAASRFKRHGVEVRFHGRDRDADRAAEQGLRELMQYTRATREELFALLDAEYAFNQLLLRRAHGWEPVTLHRYMSEAEHSAGVRGDTFTGNGVSSWTTTRDAFSNERLVTSDAWRVEWILKIWQQGREYLYHDGEREYLAIGVRVRRRPSG